MAFHVPTINVSVVDLAARLEKPASYDDKNQVPRSFSQMGKKCLGIYQLDQVYFGKTKELIMDTTTYMNQHKMS
ncbi:NAD-dependent glyceraldehyde-3-phosphate dehydrogenase [Tanacetum coccineum]